MEDKRENGGSEQDKEPEREFRGLINMKISERSLNWIIIVLGQPW